MPKKRYRYDKALGSGCLALVQLAWVHASALQHRLVPEVGEQAWRIITRNILFSMHRPVLESVIKGNLSKDYLDDERHESWRCSMRDQRG